MGFNYLNLCISSLEQVRWFWPLVLL
jgi:hypothetical protein